MCAFTHAKPLAVLLVLVSVLFLPSCGGDEGDTETGTTPYATTPYATGEGGTGASPSADLQGRIDAALAGGRELLLSAQDESGGWGDPETGMAPSVGFTALAVGALVGATPSTAVARDVAIGKALTWLASHQKEDGSIWDNPGFVNYMTSAAIGAFACAKIPAFRAVEVKARDFLAASQIAGDESDASYGGFPYKQGQGQPADLSNAQFALAALADAGLPEDDAVWTRALVYLDRVQNHSESNHYVTEVEIEGEKRKVGSGDDGGAVYYPGYSKAGYLERADGTWEARSYGSMTYALLKCLLLAGVDAEDPRVVAALGWILRNFTLERNPGFEATDDPAKAGQQGYYYYVFTVARTLAEYEALTKKPLEVRDAQGGVHAWRTGLAWELLKRRRADGWWVNEVSERWDEGAAVLATSYAMQALAELSGRHR